MTREQDNRAADLHAVIVRPSPDTAWLWERNTEPTLDEVLDDPMMALLWRADCLEPVKARATVMGLQALVKRTGRTCRGHVGSEAGKTRQQDCLAA